MRLIDKSSPAVCLLTRMVRKVALLGVDKDDEEKVVMRPGKSKQTIKSMAKHEYLFLCRGAAARLWPGKVICGLITHSSMSYSD